MTQLTGLDGKRVLVTAAASGIGLSIATSFFMAGAKVCVCDSDAAAVSEVKERHADIQAYVTDVSEPAQVEDLFNQVESRLGGLDILVNNAGIGGPGGRVETVLESEWVNTIEVNLLGAYYCCRHAIPMLEMAEGGSIVNLSSSAGLYGPPNRTPYVSSKWGLIGLTKSLAAELGERKIRVNAICPGSVEGERIDRIIAAEASLRNVDQGTVKEEFVDSSSMKVFIAKEDVAALVMFLCSEQARYISGQAIGLDGNTEVKW